jgi:hypothetical protein
MARLDGVAERIHVGDWGMSRRAAGRAILSLLTHIVTSPLSIAALRKDHLITSSAIAWLREKL